MGGVNIPRCAKTYWRGMWTRHLCHHGWSMRIYRPTNVEATRKSRRFRSQNFCSMWLDFILYNLTVYSVFSCLFNLHYHSFTALSCCSCTDGRNAEKYYAHSRQVFFPVQLNFIYAEVLSLEWLHPRYLVDKVTPGTRVSVVGISSLFNSGAKQKLQASSAIRTPFLKVVGIQVKFMLCMTVE